MYIISLYDIDMSLTAGGNAGGRRIAGCVLRGGVRRSGARRSAGDARRQTHNGGARLYIERGRQRGKHEKQDTDQRYTRQTRYIDASGVQCRPCVVLYRAGKTPAQAEGEHGNAAETPQKRRGTSRRARRCIGVWPLAPGQWPDPCALCACAPVYICTVPIRRQLMSRGTSGTGQ